MCAQLRQIEVVVETKTKDNVSIKVLIAVQYYVQPDKVDKYFYRLQQPERLIKSSIMDSVRSTLPAMTIEDAYVNKGAITSYAKVPSSSPASCSLLDS
jgi:regulator of protease activity HflC (stomatin/prohibitin superfamily)